MFCGICIQICQIGEVICAGMEQWALIQQNLIQIVLITANSTKYDIANRIELTAFDKWYHMMSRARSTSSRAASHSTRMGMA